MAWVLIALAVVSNVTANFMFKFAVATFPADPTFAALFKFAFNPYLWLGAICCTILLASYLLALREIELMVSYASVISLSLAGITIVTAILQRNGLQMTSVVGVVLIIAGILLITVFKQEKSISSSTQDGTSTAVIDTNKSSKSGSPS